MAQMLESGRLFRLDGLLDAARSSVASMVSTVSAGTRAAAGAAGGWLHGARAAVEGKLSGIQAAHADRRAAGLAVVAARQAPAGATVRNVDRAASGPQLRATQRQLQSEAAAHRQVRRVAPMAAEDATAMGETSISFAGRF